MAKGYEDTIVDVTGLPAGTQVNEALFRAIERAVMKVVTAGVKAYDRGTLAIHFEIRQPSENHPDELRVVTETEYTGIFRDFMVTKVPVERAG